MLQRIGTGDRLDALDRWDLPIRAASLADNAADGPPLGQIARYRGKPKAPGPAPAFVEMIAIARGAAGQCRGQCRRSALEIAARTEHAVRIDDDPGVAISEMVAPDRSHDCLVIDAGVGHQHAKSAQCRDRPPFERRHPLALAEPAIDGEIDAARVGDRRHPHPPLGLGCGGEPFQKAHPGFAQGFGVGHDVRLRHRHEIGGIEELADRDLVRQSPSA